MKPLISGSTIALSLLLTACAGTPLRPGMVSLQDQLAVTSTAARLPEDGSAASALGDPAATLSLDRAVQMAFAHNPEVRAALARLDATQAERVQAGLVENPMAALMAMRPEGGGRFQLEFGLMQSLYDLFTRSRRIAVADAETQRREAEVLLQLLTLAQDTRAALVEAWFAEQALQLERQRLAVEEEDQRLALREVQQGIAAVGTAMAAEAALASRGQAHAAAEASRVAARARLARLLGRASATALILPAELPAPPLAELDVPEWRDWAARHRPERRIAMAQLEQARAQAALDAGAWRATQPALGLGGMRDAEGMVMAGPELRITLPVFDRGQARLALAAARISEAEHQAEAIYRQIPLELERAVATLVALREGAAQAGRNFRQLQQLEALAERVYHQGLGERAGLQRARRERLMAEAEQLLAERALWMAALELERAAGREWVAGSG